MCIRDSSRRAAKVTRTLAQRLAELAKLLEKAGHHAEDVARFLMRCLFTMFAEDIELIPRGSFKDLLGGLVDEPENFKPAAVTSIEGVLISGTAGANSPCNLCTIEIFLDDDDGINEAIQSLAVVTADANGNWTATLPAALTAGQCLRTTTTTYEFGDMAGIYACTTSGLSELYVPGYEVFLPMISR